MSKAETSEKTAIRAAEKKLDMAAQVLARAALRIVNADSALGIDCGEHAPRGNSNPRPRG